MTDTRSTHHMRAKAFGSTVIVIMVLHQGLSFIGAQGSGIGLCSASQAILVYFPLPESLCYSLVDPCILDHQSSRLYYYFSTKCFDFQPTQEIKSPPSSQFSPSVPSPICLFLPSFLPSARSSPILLSSLQY